jgi:hypothetical protein
VGRIVAMLMACMAAIVGLVAAHVIEAGALHDRMAHALPASPQFAGTLAASAAQTMGQVVAGVAPCRAAQLRARAAWQGATGSLVGGITIVNRGPTACAVSGRPGVVIRGSNGNIARTIERPARAFEGAPVGTTVLVPGQRAFVFVLWMNFCDRIRPPLSLVVMLPRGAGHLVAPVARPAGTARCNVPDTPSSLAVGPFDPAYDPGVSAIRTYYRFVDEHRWSAAYDIAVDQQAPFARFVAGYRDTAHVAIDLLAVPTYRVPYGGATHACVGIHLTAQQRTGAVWPYGGWIMAEVRSASQAYVVIGGSVIRPGGKPVIPTHTTCSAHVPLPSPPSEGPDALRRLQGCLGCVWSLSTTRCAAWRKAVA